MKNKILLSLILLFFLQSCGYTPIYSNTKKIDFGLNIKSIEGNDEMNNLVSSQIRKYTKTNAEKVFDVNIFTNYEKIIMSKNKKGEATNYLIKTKIEFNLINVDINETFLFQEETKTSSINNKFEFKRYENKILSNFINSKIEQFILKLSSVK